MTRFETQRRKGRQGIAEKKKLTEKNTMKEQSEAELAQKLILMQELGMTEKEVEELLEKRERLVGHLMEPVARNVEDGEVEEGFNWNDRNEHEFHECCWNCRFMLRSQSSLGSVILCRRRAPLPFTVPLSAMEKDMQAWWPEVESDDWCGDFEINPKCFTPAPKKKPETES